jgi:anaerobic selenocysteine-containing dehydrogenase
MDEIAHVLERIIDEHGARAVAEYSGTSCIMSAPTTLPLVGAFMNAIGSKMRFAPETIDKPGKHIARALHGSWMAPGQGFDRPDVILLVGNNPLVTYTGFPAGNPGRWLAEQRRRGLRMIVVDPRRTDVAKRAFLHLQARPGEDTAILAGMIRVILDERLHDADFVQDNATNLDVLREHVAPYTPDVVARRAGIRAEDLVLAARTYAGASRGYAMAGTGPAMSGPSSLVAYLILNLETLCGQWLRAGERVANPGTLIPALTPIAQASPPTSAIRPGETMRVRGLTNTTAGLPTAALADEILLDGPGRVRALLVYGGNPVAAWPDQLKTIAAMRSLELLVQIDPWMSQTARLAHYVIAPKMPLEMAGTTYVNDMASRLGTGYGLGDAYAQFADAAVDPPAGSELIEEWELYYGLAQRMGLQLTIPDAVAFGAPLDSPTGIEPSAPVVLDMETKPTTAELLHLASRNSRVPLDDVKEHPHGALFPDPAVYVAPKQPGWTGRLDLANADMMAALDRDANADMTSPRPYSDPPTATAAANGGARFQFRLLCRRVGHMYNSAGNDPSTNRGKPYNPAFLHPADLRELHLRVGDLVTITSPRASIIGIVESDPSLRRGVVSMTHGYGDVPERDGEYRTIGSSTNRLLFDDVQFDPYTGQPQMSNIEVRVERVDEATLRS